MASKRCVKPNLLIFAVNQNGKPECGERDRWSRAEQAGETLGLEAVSHYSKKRNNEYSDDNGGLPAAWVPYKNVR